MHCKEARPPLWGAAAGKASKWAVVRSADIPAAERRAIETQQNLAKLLVGLGKHAEAALCTLKSGILRKIAVVFLIV